MRYSLVALGLAVAISCHAPCGAFMPTPAASGGVLRVPPGSATSCKTSVHGRPHRPHQRARSLSAPYLEMGAVGCDEDPNRYRDALTNTALSVGGAVAFGIGIRQFLGAESSLEYFAGYAVEQSLSVDNIFVFLLLFEYFQVPVREQSRVLSWGLVGAMVMRALFIVAGEAAMNAFQPVLLGFAGILVFSAYKLLVEGGEDEEEDLSNNKIVALSRQFLDCTDKFDGDRFFTMEEGVRKATPLLLALVCIELSDVVFAVDSVPAVFGVTKDPFIVYTSNIWAILSLRSLYAVLANAIGDLPYLRPAVAGVLGFVGAKLAVEFFGYEIPTGLSLGIISAALGGGVGLSVFESRQQQA